MLCNIDSNPESYKLQDRGFIPGMSNYSAFRDSAQTGLMPT
jgi:hypothetical protein